MLYAFPVFTTELRGHVVYFSFWMLKSQSLYVSSLKKTDIKFRNGGPQRVENCNPVVLCYLALNALFVGLFSEIDLTYFE